MPLMAGNESSLYAFYSAHLHNEIMLIKGELSSQPPNHSTQIYQIGLLTCDGICS